VGQAPLRAGQVRQTNPISGSWPASPGVPLYKQTQFLGAGRAAPGVGCTNKANLQRAPIPGRGATRSPLAVPPGPSVRNKANFGEASPETRAGCAEQSQSQARHAYEA